MKWTGEPGGLSNRLREIIRDRGLTAYGLARDSGVDVRAIQRFIACEKDLRLESVDRIAGVLGLRLVEGARRPTKPRPTNPEETP